MTRQILFAMACCAFLFLGPSVFADTVILKSGKKIEGKIIEKTADFVRVEFDGIQVSFAHDEIEKILEGADEKQGEVPEGEKKAVTDEPNPMGPTVVKYLREAKYSEAISYLENILKESPSSKRAYVYLGACYYRFKKYPQAIESLEKARAIENQENIEDEEKLKSGFFRDIYLGLAYKASGNYAKAKECFVRAYKSGGKKGQENLFMTIALLDLIGDYAEDIPGP